MVASKQEAPKLGSLTSRGRDKAPSREQTESTRTGTVDGRSRRRTGRSAQMIFRTTPDYRARVEAIADTYGWNFNEALEHCIEAMEEKMRGQRS
jgi:hypothetical protein